MNATLFAEPSGPSAPFYVYLEYGLTAAACSLALWLVGRVRRQADARVDSYYMLVEWAMLLSIFNATLHLVMLPWISFSFAEWHPTPPLTAILEQTTSCAVMGFFRALYKIGICYLLLFLHVEKYIVISLDMGGRTGFAHVHARCPTTSNVRVSLFCTDDRAITCFRVYLWLWAVAKWLRDDIERLRWYVPLPTRDVIVRLDVR